ncbi:MAG: hypothetical protein ABH804_00110 [archaeon]
MKIEGVIEFECSRFNEYHARDGKSQGLKVQIFQYEEPLEGGKIHKQLVCEGLFMGHCDKIGLKCLYETIVKN